MENKKLFKFIGLLLFVVVAFLVSRYYFNLDALAIRDYVAGFGMWAPAVYIVIYAVGTVLFFPGSVLTISGGVIFGAVWGTLYNIIGIGIGASLAFLVARYFGKGFVEEVIHSKFQKVSKYDDKLEENGFFTVIFLRLIPIFPFNGLNFALGLSRVKFRDYFFATVLGTIPGTFAYTYFGSSLAMLDVFDIAVSVVLILLLSMIFPLYKKYNKRRK